MLTINPMKLPNGAHANKFGDSVSVPDGWLVVPPEMEEEAISYLPFIELELENGQIVGVSQGAVPEIDEPELDEPPSLEARVSGLEEENTALMLALTDLFEQIIEEGN